MATHKTDTPDHTTVPAAPAPGKAGQPSTEKPEGLDDLSDEGKGITAPAVKPDRRGRE